MAISKSNLQSMRTPLDIEIDKEFKSLVSSGYQQMLPGVIASVILRNNTVFAVIRRDHADIKENALNEGGPVHGHLGYFNSHPYGDSSKYTLPELAIPTDINPIGNQLSRYIGTTALVTVQNGVAIFANTTNTPSSLSIVPPQIIKYVREEVEKRDPNNTDRDIFNSKWDYIWESFGILREKISDLQGLIYNPEDMENKIISFDGEGSWIKDTQSPLDNEVVITTNDLLLDLNKLGMKTNTCHLPVKPFSAK